MRKTKENKNTIYSLKPESELQLFVIVLIFENLKSKLGSEE